MFTSMRRYVKKLKTRVVVSQNKTSVHLEHTRHPIGGVQMVNVDNDKIIVGWCNIAGGDSFSYTKAREIMNQRGLSGRYTFHRNSPDSINELLNNVPVRLHDTIQEMIVKINERIDNPRKRDNAVV
jgi:hypothetical protein